MADRHSSRHHSPLIPQNSLLAALIQRAQVQGLSTDPNLPEESRRILGAADQDRRQLTAEELLCICGESGMNAALPKQLQRQADDLVNQARTHLLKQQPQLVQPGGALFPSERAEACWRDCWNFLRVIVYAVACNQSSFTNEGGMAALRELYQRMNVPAEGLNIALNQLKALVLQGVEREADRSLISDCFQHLSKQLNKNAVKS